MRKHWVLMLSFAFFLLLFIQSITVFIESIYILELLSTSLDEKVLGVLFLFSPVLLFIFGKKALAPVGLIYHLPVREGVDSLPRYNLPHDRIWCCQCGRVNLAAPDARHLPEQG